LKTYNDNGGLASKMLNNKSGLARLKENKVRSILINKNLCFYYWLRKKIGKKWALVVANVIEETILLFGREVIPYFNRNDEMLTEKQE
jgi:hypothetical protein